jgi:CRP-like cAMP-binding protein
MSTVFAAESTATTLQNHLLGEIWRLGRYRLLANMYPLRLEAGQLLQTSIGPTRDLYFIEAGVVSLVDVMESGRTIEVASVGREGVIGMSSLLGNGDEKFQCLVQIQGKALRVSAETVRAEMEQDKAVAGVLHRYCGVLLSQVMQCVACNGLHSVQERWCRWLLCAQDRLNSTEIPITHEGLAHILGVRRASISSVLQPLQEAALVRYGRGKLVVIDRPRLEATACECYRSMQSSICGKD